jgi:D-glutamate cyclase
MTSDERLDALRDVIQADPGGRGLARDCAANLLTVCRNDFRQACQGLAQAHRPSLGIVTGFFIPRADPPCAETDGPLGALFLARALVPLGIPVTLLVEAYLINALEAGLRACGLRDLVTMVVLPGPDQPWQEFLEGNWRRRRDELTHLLALERVGPAHTLESLRRQPGTTDDDVAQFQKDVPSAGYDRCQNMRGQDITALTAPAHVLFEEGGGLTTIGIGDGGNEIGMGKIPWDIIRRNIPRGDRIACRVRTDYLIVAGVSNWGAYALAAGLAVAGGSRLPVDLFDTGRERDLLRIMVEAGPLVDGTTAQQTGTVDGLDWETYGAALRNLGPGERGVSNP